MSDCHTTWMPEFRPPWKVSREVFPAPRAEYAAGRWGYAVGRPAIEHRKYGSAVDIARKGRWNPWWIRSYADVSAVLSGHYMHEARGMRAVDFLGELVLNQGVWNGTRFSLIDWQRYDLTMPLYGWVRESKIRRFTKGGIWIPKKNGKSGYCSGVGLLHLRADGEHSPICWTCASAREQAGIIHDECCKFARDTPDLCDDLVILKGRKRIRFDAMDGVLDALSADSDIKEGINWSFGVFDEIHVGSKKVFDALSRGGASREEPLMLTVSTAGIYNPISIGWEQWDYAMKIRNGSIVDDSFLALQYYATDEDPWDDIETAYLANPSLGVTCNEAYIREGIVEARNSGNSSKYKRYHLNIWVNAAQSWISPQTWDACACA